MSQKAIVADRVRDYYDKQAKERMAEGQKHGGEVRQGSTVATCPPREQGKARDQAGKVVGVSGRTMDRAKKVREQGVPELVKQVESGALDVSNAAKVAELPKRIEAIEEQLERRS